jgi:hypothetical protein
MTGGIIMHIFSYVITHDAGFAPNPFGGFLTLATCKPQIRKHVRKGDFIAGTGSAATVGNRKLVYAAQIADVIPIEDYGKLPDYDIKRPSGRGNRWRKHGDNIYFKANGKWKQRRSVCHFQESMAHDLGGENVLICNRFWYFGRDAIEIPPELSNIIKKGPNHKRIRDEVLVDQFIEWLTSLPEGLHGTPELEPDGTNRCSRGPKGRTTESCSSMRKIRAT